MKTILTTIMTLLSGVALAAPEYCSTWAEVKARLEAGISVMLTQDMDADSEIRANSGDLTIDMNGKTVTRTATTRLFNYLKSTIRLTDSVGGGLFTAGSSTYPHRGSFALINENATFVIDGNVMIDGFGAGGSVEGEGQGGAFTLNSGSLVINSGTIRNCSANSSGGAVYLSAGTSFTMNGGMITNCTATTGGGVCGKGTVTMSGGRIVGNTATNGEGGGVYVSAGTFTMTGGEISGNTANGSVSKTGNGGGVALRGGRCTMSGGEISGNTAMRFGGGIAQVGGTFALDGGTIRENKATYGGGIDSDGATVTMSGGSVVSNTATDGGGVYHWPNGTFTMTGGEIAGCTASRGGGVYNLGTFTVNGGTLSGCKASKGGALLNKATATICGGTIRDNEATGAGDPYGGFGHDWNDANCHTCVYGGSFSGNKAPTGHCQLFVGYAYKKSGLLYGGVFAADPTAADESAGCLVLQNGAAVTKVGDVYLVGKGVMLTDGKLAGGSFTFNPTERLYKELGISLAEGCHVTRSGTGYAIVAVRGAALTGLVNEAISFHGFLTAADGTPLTENSVVKIDFKLYPTASSEELLWARRIPVTIDGYSGYYVDITDTIGQSYQAPGGVKPTCATLREALARHAQISPGPLWLAYEPVAATVATPFPRVPLYFQPLAQRASSTAQATVASVSSVETTTLDAADASTVTADRLVVGTDLVRLNGLSFDVPHRDVPLNATGAVKLRSVTGLACSAATNTLGALLADLPATADSDCGRVVKHVVNGTETIAAIYYSKGDATTLPEGSTNVYVWSFGPLVETTAE